MSAYKELLAKANLKPRAEQQALFEALDAVFCRQTGVFLAQADTGVGKTLAVTASAMSYLRRHPRARYVISAPTLALCREYMSSLASTGLTAAMLLSCRNFFCHERLDYQLRLAGGGEAVRQMFKSMYDWEGTIDEYIVEFGSLPNGVNEGDVCQTKYGASSRFCEEREQALQAQVLVTTHAMLAVDVIAFGNVLSFDTTQSCLVIDEADAFVDTLRDFQNQHFNILRESAPIKTLVESPFISYLDDEVAKLRKNLKKGLRCSALGRDVAIAVLGRLYRHATQYKKKKMTQDDSLRYNDYIQQIQRLVEVAQSSENVAFGLTDVLGEPTIAVLNPYFSRTFGYFVKKSNMSVACISGTLSVSHDIDEGTKWIERDLGLKDLDVTKSAFSPLHFGSLSMQIFRAKNPMYQLDDSNRSLSSDWIKEVAAHLQTLSGKVLVVTSSFDESKLLGEYLGERALVHRQGQKITGLKADFVNGAAEFFISPSAHTGLNFEGANGRSCLNSVVITRLPFTPPNSILKDLRGSPDFSESKLNTLRFQEYKGGVDRVIRRGRQIIGRGIRHQSDSIKFIVMDNRFPLYAEVGGRHYRLNAIVPKRFQNEYREADVLGLGASIDKTDLSVLC